MPNPNSGVQDILAFLAFFVPGFIMTQAYNVFVRSGDDDWQKRVPAVISYSAVYYAFTLWVFLVLPPRAFWVAAYGVAFVGPVAVGLATVLVRGGSLRVRLRPQATPWDELFARISRSKNGAIVTVMRKNGPPLMGYFGALSYAAAYPHDHEIYVQALCETQNGQIVIRSPATGFLIVMSEVSYITFQAPPAPLLEA